jgi:hypothetical protein
MRKGINLYKEVSSVFGSENESEQLEHFSGSGEPPCIFLSHRSSNKAAVRAIGEYIKNAGVNIYMDIDDLLLQAAVAGDNHETITMSIERGITTSTELMVFVSEETFHSWWVPYEIGYGKKAEKYLSSLRLNDTPTVPSYLNIPAVRQIDGIEDLNIYLREVHKRDSSERSTNAALRYLQSLNEDVEMDKVLTNFSGSHPLCNYLDK